MSVGAEVVIRDCAGYATAALSKKITLPIGTFGERGDGNGGGGVTFAWDVSIYDVVFECDSKIVFDSLNGSN